MECKHGCIPRCTLDQADPARLPPTFPCVPCCTQWVRLLRMQSEEDLSASAGPDNLVNMPADVVHGSEQKHIAERRTFMR